MACGVEIVLGFGFQKWHVIEDAAGFRMPRPLPGDPHGYDRYEPGYFDGMSEEDAIQEYWESIDCFGILEQSESIQSINRILLEAWKDAVADMGWRYIGLAGGRNPSLGHHNCETPLGKREFRPWELSLFYDHANLGERPVDGLLGVSISGRYKPVFLDWANPHGTIWNQVIGPNPPKEMMIARDRIIDHVPCFEYADWIVRENFY